MLKFTELFKPETIRQGMIVASKKRLFEMLAEIASKSLLEQQAFSTDEYENYAKNIQQDCFGWLWGREKLGNSSLGGGVAMPKARLPEQSSAIGVFIQLETPIDYESVDKQEVDLVFAIFIPAEQCTLFISELPKLSERMIDKSLVKQLRAAQSAEEIWQIFEFFDQTQYLEQVESSTDEVVAPE